MDFDYICKSIAAGLCGSAFRTYGVEILAPNPADLSALRQFADVADSRFWQFGTPYGPVGVVVQCSVVLGFLFGHFYQRLPGRTGVIKGMLFGFAVWIAMNLTFFPAIGKGLFAAQTGLGIAPTFFTLAMVLTYSVTLGVAYSIFTSQARGRAI
jgi:hypothetical protein